MLAHEDWTDATEAERLEGIRELGLSIEATFVPWRKSRKADEKYKSLNWSIVLEHEGQRFDLVEYTEGRAHCPSYQFRETVDSAAATDRECEHGHAFTGTLPRRNKPILPNVVSLWYSLACDASVLDVGTYEEWAGEYGFDPDSRKGEVVYRECLTHALKLRNALGEAKLAELHRIMEGY